MLNPHQKHIQTALYMGFPADLAEDLVSEAYVICLTRYKMDLDDCTKSLVKKMIMEAAHNLFAPRKTTICGRKTNTKFESLESMMDDGFDFADLKVNKEEQYELLALLLEYSAGTVAGSIMSDVVIGDMTIHSACAKYHVKYSTFMHFLHKIGKVIEAKSIYYDNFGQIFRRMSQKLKLRDDSIADNWTQLALI